MAKFQQIEYIPNISNQQSLQKLFYEMSTRVVLRQPRGQLKHFKQYSKEKFYLTKEVIEAKTKGKNTDARKQVFRKGSFYFSVQ